MARVVGRVPLTMTNNDDLARLYASMTLDTLCRLRAAFIADQREGSRQQQPDLVRFCARRLQAIDAELHRRRILRDSD